MKKRKIFREKKHIIWEQNQQLLFQREHLILWENACHSHIQFDSIGIFVRNWMFIDKYVIYLFVYSVVLSAIFFLVLFLEIPWSIRIVLALSECDNVKFFIVRIRFISIFFVLVLFGSDLNHCRVYILDGNSFMLFILRSPINLRWLAQWTEITFFHWIWHSLEM